MKELFRHTEKLVSASPSASSESSPQMIKPHAAILFQDFLSSYNETSKELSLEISDPLYGSRLIDDFEYRTPGSFIMTTLLMAAIQATAKTRIFFDSFLT